MKKVLGLDLGTTSIGWAIVNQSETDGESSSIIKAGVRVNPLSVDEKDSFGKGKPTSTNAGRTLKRGARRNLQRFKQRRDNLLSLLQQEGWIDDKTVLSESGKNSTWKTLEVRAKSATEEVSLTDLAKILLSINKKRGYKSNRKTNALEDGTLIDGMKVAKILAEKDITPAEYSYSLILEGNKSIPQYYASDIKREYDKIWDIQSSYYPEILTQEFKTQLSNQSGKGAATLFLAKFGIYSADNKGKDKKTQAIKWRVDALKKQLEKDVLAYVITNLRTELSASSNYLGAISDRSKELFFNNQTIGQYLFSGLMSDSSFSTKNKVFYRQDYIDEFEKIWNTQKLFHRELNDDLKKKIKDSIIFYQRDLKSQKGLVSYCEFESQSIELNVNGKKSVKLRGCKVAPKSSFVFQEFKIWQILNNVTISDKTGNFDTRYLSQSEKELLANTLAFRRKMSQSEALKLLGQSTRQFVLNYKELEGNETNYLIYKAFLTIVALSGHEECDIDKTAAGRIQEIVSCVFDALGFSTDILTIDTLMPKEDYERQPLFKLWHLLYSYQGDASAIGDVALVKRISNLCSIPEDYAKVLAAIKFNEDYASLSHKAMRKILPFLKDGNRYDVACTYAGYNHSNARTKDENDTRSLKDTLDVLPKGALRNPVVEKIVNQMVNVVNHITDEYGKPDEIHIELARELKLNAAQRANATAEIADKTKKNEEYSKTIKEKFGIQNPTKNDILRYRLYQELKDNGYKTLYSNQFIPEEYIFSPKIDIEHIIPQARLFDDSFSNKTLEYSDVNREKSNMTAMDYVREKYDEEGVEDYINKINDLSYRGVISRTKRNNLLMEEKDIPSDFLERDLTMSQYIAKKAMEILESYARIVVPTTGSITAKLRSDWQLVDVMKELNIPKYAELGMTYVQSHGDNNTTRIENWTKRSDHRHHAMDALTIAFTKPAHIQLLNNLNAKSDKSSAIYGIFCKETVKTKDGWIFTPPMPIDELRSAFKKELESLLVSIKTKNKVVTKNVNKTRCKNGIKTKTELSVRGQLHKEQVYGLRKQYETYYLSVGGKLTQEEISHVASKSERNALLERIQQFGGDSKKAFTGANSLEKNPIFLDAAHTKSLPEKVKCVRLVDVFSIRKGIGKDLSIDKVLDRGTKKILKDRISEFGGDQAKAFSNLNENPIYLNKDKGIVLKRVAIVESLPAVALHDKRDKEGKLIVDASGNHVPTDFVNLRNNHHSAIYVDAEGEIHESVVSMFEALQRITTGLPVIDKSYNADLGWRFLFSIKINEMFVFPNFKTGFNPSDIDLTNEENYAEISQNLYRVQSLSPGDYWFRHHLETELNDDTRLKNITWKRIKSLKELRNVAKVRINHIGKIVTVGEYD